MKKLTALLLALCMAVAFCACGNQNGTPQTDPPVPVTQPQPEETEAAEAVPEQTEPVPEVTEAPEVPVAEVDVLNLTKAYATNYQWDDDTMLALSEYSTVTLWQEDAARYPEMAQVLEQLATMQKNSMEDEYENLLSFAREALDAAPDSFETQVSNLDIQVRRADSVAVSILSDSWSDYGWIDDFRGMHGTNFDTATGKELVITDVIKDMSQIPATVAQELNSHMWAGDYTYDDAVADYFRNTPADGISWTLDYNGVTFYFGDGDLEEPGNGRLTATVSFAEYPELFEEKYMAVPEAYAVELPLDHSFFTDLDGDGDLEELNVTGWYDTVMDMYAKYGIYSEAGGSYHYEDYCCDELHPYYVKTGDGHWLYLFCQFNEGSFPQMSLVAYNVSGGDLIPVGEKNMGPGYIPMNINRMPLDPDSLWLDDYDSMAQDAMEYAVGSNGLPELKGESRIVFDPETMKMGTVDNGDLSGTSWAGYAMVNSESAEVFPLPYTEPDGTQISVSMELYADGTGWLEFRNRDESITWDCDGAYSVWIVREDGQRADMTLYTMGGESRMWLLIDLDGYLLWLYEA